MWFYFDSIYQAIFVDFSNMIGLSRVGSDIKDLSHFRPETTRCLVPYFEHFQAVPELQNLRRKTSRCGHEVSEDRKSISDFISEFSHPTFGFSKWFKK